MAEIVDDSKPFTVKLAAPAKLEIQLPIRSDKNEYVEGNEVKIYVTVKNVGATKCLAKVCMYDVEGSKQTGIDLKPGELIDCETYERAWGEWGTMNPGQVEEFEVNTDWAGIFKGRTITMPNKDWKLKLDAVRKG